MDDLEAFVTAQQRAVVACIQVNPADDIRANLAAAADRVREAARAGAELILLPEHVAFLHASSRAAREAAQPEEAHTALAMLRGLAQETGRWLLVGSLPVRVGPDATDAPALASRSFLLDPGGRVAARYDKIHMFDVTLPGGRVMHESGTYRPGGEAVCADTPLGRLGLSICYDVRFPALYRTLAGAGARLLAVPAAFTRPTGAAHWHALLRARAIENGAYVLAPATCGDHPGGHATFGHSLVVDPWGVVLAEAGEGPETLVVEIDLSAVDDARSRLPSLRHDRPFALRPECAPVSQRAAVVAG